MLEVVFAVIKSNQDIDKLRIFEHDSLYTAYPDDTTFFVKNHTSVIEIFKKFWSQKNLSKNEIARKGV